MKPIKKWAVLVHGELETADEIHDTRSTADYHAEYTRRFDGSDTQIVRVEIREVPKKAKVRR